MERYILFYSNYCQHCKDFVQQLYKSNFNEKFQKICVDGKNNIPKEINTVPTIIVSRFPRPMAGEEAFHWLRGMNMSSLQEKESQDTNTPKSSNKDGDPTNQNYSMGAVSAFSSTMGGYSDNFSYLGDSSAPIEHNFTFLDKNNETKIRTPNDGGIDTSSGKKSEIDNAYEKMMSQRSKEISGPPARI